jgi:hypothetical protein
MKARQIATALHSVYAVDLQDRIRFIERDPEGFWGPWQDAGADAGQIVHHGDVIARIGPDHQVSALQRASQLPWLNLDLQARELAVTRMPDGAPALFASDGDHAVWHTWTPAPASPWAGWEPLAGPASELAAAVIPGGGLAVFGIHDGAIHHRWQNHLMGGWEEWTPLEGPPHGARSLEVTTISGGGLVLFALGGDGGLYHRWQNHPFGRWQSWEPLATGIGSFAVTKAASGGLAVFAIRLDGLLQYRRQPGPFGEWSSWMELDGSAKSVAAQASYTDGLEVFVIGLDDDVYHKWCGRLDSPWSDWAPLDHEPAPFRLSRKTPLPTPMSRTSDP